MESRLNEVDKKTRKAFKLAKNYNYFGAGDGENWEFELL
jgi:hypothetical protein